MICRTIKMFFQHLGALKMLLKPRLWGRVQGGVALCVWVCQQEWGAALSLPPSHSPQSWCLSEVPQVALNNAISPSCQASHASCNTSHWLPPHAPLQPEWCPQHFRCSAAAALPHLLCGPLTGHGRVHLQLPVPWQGWWSLTHPIADRAVPADLVSPRAAPRQHLPVCLQGQQTPTRSGLWRSEVLPSAWRQVSATPDYISYSFAYTGLENGLSLQMQVLAKFFLQKNFKLLIF